MVNQDQNSDMGEGGIKNGQKFFRHLLWMAPEPRAGRGGVFVFLTKVPFGLQRNSATMNFHINVRPTFINFATERYDKVIYTKYSKH